MQEEEKTIITEEELEQFQKDNLSETGTREANLGIDLYAMNKNLVKQQTVELSEAALNSKKEIVKNYLKATNNEYYMLLCNDRKDYTIFKRDNKEDKNEMMALSKILIDECIKNRGEIRAVDLTEDNSAIEIWLIVEDEAYVYYFFPYDNAIIDMSKEVF